MSPQGLDAKRSVYCTFLAFWRSTTIFIRTKFWQNALTKTSDGISGEVYHQPYSFKQLRLFAIFKSTFYERIQVLHIFHSKLQLPNIPNVLTKKIQN